MRSVSFRIVIVVLVLSFTIYFSHKVGPKDPPPPSAAHGQHSHFTFHSSAAAAAVNRTVPPRHVVGPLVWIVAETSFAGTAHRLTHSCSRAHFNTTTLRDTTTTYNTAADRQQFIHGLTL